MTVEENRSGRYSVSTDPEKLDLDVIHSFLSSSYWARSIPRSVVARAVAGSLCFGIYDGRRQVGFARVITDRATFAYLADVFVLERHRRRGLATLLMKTIVAHPDLQGLRRFLLATKDAHRLYEKFGFQPIEKPEHYLEILRSGVYEEPS